jgi:hypothetical protein
MYLGNRKEDVNFEPTSDVLPPQVVSYVGVKNNSIQLKKQVNGVTKVSNHAIPKASKVEMYTTYSGEVYAIKTGQYLSFYSKPFVGILSTGDITVGINVLRSDEYKLSGGIGITREQLLLTLTRDITQNTSIGAFIGHLNSGLCLTVEL